MVADMVEQLPELEYLTTSWEKAITQLREMYDGMTSYQQQFVSEDTLKTLSEYEEKMKELLLQAEQSGETTDDTEGNEDDTTVA